MIQIRYIQSSIYHSCPDYVPGLKPGKQVHIAANTLTTAGPNSTAPKPVPVG